MATVYSLLCWGGKDGKAVTGSSAATDRITISNHGIQTAGLGVQFTAGTVPTGGSPVSLALNTTYYAKRFDDNDFELYTNSGLTTRITWTGAGSGLTMKSAYYMGLSDKSRWTTSGTERIYDSMMAWRTARYSAAGAFDTEVLEIAEAFDDVYSSGTITLNIPCAECMIYPKVNGVYSSAYHNGGYLSGYRLRYTAGANYALTFSGNFVTVEDITLYSTTYNFQGVTISGNLNTVQRCFIVGGGSGNSGYGIVNGGNANNVLNNVVTNIGTGVTGTGFGTNACITANNTIIKCATGFTADANTRGWWYNNVAYGCTTNWGTAPGQAQGTGYNAGGSTGGTPWGTGSITTVDSTAFYDYANNNFRPASASSVIEEAGTAVAGMTAEDLSGTIRPDYNNGDSTDLWDIGAFEFDHGVTPPNTQPISVTGYASGTRIILTDSTGAQFYNSDTAGSTVSFNYDVGTGFNGTLYARKGSSATYYKPLEVQFSVAQDGGASVNLSGLQQEDIGAATYSAGVPASWDVNTSTKLISWDSTGSTASTRYSVQSLHSWLADYYDDSATGTLAVPMASVTNTIFELRNGGSISDTHTQKLTGGSIEFENGQLYTNLYTVGGLTAAPSIYIYRGTTKLTPFWSSGHIDVLLRAKDTTGALLDSGIFTAFARKWGYTYDNYQVDLSGGGRVVAPLSNLADPNITDAESTVGAWTTMSWTFDTSYSYDFGDTSGAQPYRCTIDCGGEALADVYQRAQYLTRDGSAATLNGIPGDRYLSVDSSSVTPNKAAPFGTYAGGFWTVAQGVWLANVSASDQYSYQLTDMNGNTHQAVETTNQSVSLSNLTPGVRYQIYDLTSSTELANAVAGGVSVIWSDPSTPVASREIRIRLQYVSGTNANKFVEVIAGTCGTTPSTSAVSYRANEEVDPVYEANAIDGSTVTGITIDDSVDRVKINIAGGTVSWAQVYAYNVYWLGTEAGIRDDGAFIEAVDAANYLLTGFQIRNTSPTPLTITGGWGRDATTLTIADIIDHAGSAGNIYPLPDHVVNNIVTVGGVNIITGDIADIPTASAVADAVWSKTLP